ncbi:MAG: SOS response-associated peptidase [Desulfarculus sp.]|nr:SOS response-associated peptidase [Desulfarculus sp.]
MCGRYRQTSDLASLERRFGLQPSGLALTPRYNLAPGQSAPVVVAPEERRDLRLMRWGLVPPWAADPSQGHKMINARAETLAAKPAFRGAYRSRRCLVLADGFYEWAAPPRPGAPKQPYSFGLLEGGPFAMAGLWERWQPPGQAELLSFSIVTVPANALVGAIHERMPALLLPEQEALWLDPAQHGPAALAGLLRPYPSDLMQAHPVSPALNRAGAEGPELAQPWRPSRAPGLFD